MRVQYSYLWQINIFCNINHLRIRPLFDIYLRKLSLYSRPDRRVFRLTAGASQRIAGMSGVFDRIAPGLRKYKIALGQIFPFCVRELRHWYTFGPFNLSTGIFCSRDGAGLSKVALQAKVACRFPALPCRLSGPSWPPSTMEDR